MLAARKTVSKVLGIIVSIVFMLAGLGGCAFFSLSMCSHYADTHPDRSEYVGVWACYEMKTDEAEVRAKKLDEVQIFLVLRQSGEAETIVCIDKDNPFIIESKWVTTSEDKRYGTDEGIELIGGDYDLSNPYSFFYYPGKTELIDESLIDGGLSIDYGYRKEYYEKISNDPNYQPWIAADNSSEAPTSEGDTTAPEEAPSPTIPSSAIPWNEASAHVGETVTLYGLVVGAEYANTSNGQPTFLDIGASYPDKNRLSITIWGKNRAAFSPSPEALYEGKTICVTGEVYLYDGVCNIEITSPDQIEIIG